jgi:hypothetical protein
MIIDKKTGSVISGNTKSTSAKSTDTSTTGTTVPVQESEPSSGIIEVTKAIQAILRGVRWEYGNSESPLIFKTVQWNDGQFERLIRKGGNTEFALGLPAAFVHFVDTSYLVSQQRIGEGRAKLRIQFVLNRLNSHDADHELDPLYVTQRIDQEIVLHKSEYDCLSERCQIVYWDFPESWDNGMQMGWLTYEIWFKETSIWITRLKKYTHIVMPPFTNHSDQTAEANEHNHTDADHPRTYDEATSFNIPGETDDTESGN